MKQPKHKVKYTDEPIGQVRIIKDFLPPPERLVLKDEAVEVKLLLNKSSVDFFKHVAKEQHTHYRKMMRVLLEQYVAHYR